MMGLAHNSVMEPWTHKHEGQHDVALHQNAMVVLPPPVMETWDSKKSTLKLKVLSKQAKGLPER